MTITITITMTITSNEYHSTKTTVKLTTTVTTLLDCSDYNVVTTVQLKSIVTVQLTMQLSHYTGTNPTICSLKVN